MWLLGIRMKPYAAIRLAQRGNTLVYGASGRQFKAHCWKLHHKLSQAALTTRRSFNGSRGTIPPRPETQR